jgi:hydrogenase maturation protease
MTLLSTFDDPRCLVVGVGNVGREDDGLGWAFVDWLEDAGACARAERVRRYQLLLEDADLFARFDRALVVDATQDQDVLAYRAHVPEPRLDVTFTSHAMSVSCVLATAATCFGRIPAIQVLAIRGYSWGLRMGLTTGAAANLDAAIRAAGGDPTDPASRWTSRSHDAPATGVLGG